jgi:clan AA aspartic protease
MGIIYQHIRLANFGRDDIEEIDANALVDSGAAELCIPQHIANQLQLKQLEEREVRIANGDRMLVPYVGGVRVAVFGRQTVTSAVVIGDQVLLGAIPMEAMDLVIHPRSLTLMPNPDSPNVPASLAMGVRK